MSPDLNFSSSVKLPPQSIRSVWATGRWKKGRKWQEGRKEGRMDGKKEGRKEERKWQEGREEGRKEMARRKEDRWTSLKNMIK